MTYKRILEGMIETDSRMWVKNLLKENNIAHIYVEAEFKDWEAHDAGGKLYTCKVIVQRDNSWIPVRLEVGGYIDDTAIYHSVIWNDARKEIWMSTDTSRIQLGIERFAIA